MRQDEIWDDDTARRYDTPETGMFSPEVLEPMVRRLAELAAGGATSASIPTTSSTSS